MQTFTLSTPKARQSALDAVRLADEGMVVTIKQRTRSLDQNAFLHSLIGDVVRSGFRWAGKERDADTWKVLFVSAHAIATKEPGQNIMGMEGELVFLRESTARMTKARSSSLIEYIISFCTQNEIPITDNRYEDLVR